MRCYDRMLAAIDLDDQLPFEADEIYDVSPNRSLAPELQPLELSKAKAGPGTALCVCQLLPELSRESAAHAAKYSKGTVAQWADESHKAARKVVYGKLPKAAQGSPIVLDAAYEKAADAVVYHQLAVAGARLAKVLNAELQ